MPVSRRTAVSRSTEATVRSRRRTSARAASTSSSGSTSSRATAATSLSTPLRRSSWARARRASPLPGCRDCTQVRANASSSTRPPSSKRSRSRPASSSGTPLRASFVASSARLRACPVSWSSRILRPTASWWAAGPWACSSGVEAAASQASTPSWTSPGTRGLEVDPGRLHLDRGVHVDLRPDAELLEDPLLELVGEVGVVAQEVAGVLLALPELVALVGVPGAGLPDEPRLDTDVDQAALAADALAVHDVELRLLERRGHLVLHDLDAGAVADHVLAVLQRLDPAHVEAHRGVELQRLATGGGLGRAEHHADLLAQLVDEDHRGAGVAQGTGHLAQRLAHQPRLEADVAVAHLALDLGAGHERGDRVDHDQVERAGADQHVGDLKRLLTGVRLGDQQGVGVDAEVLGVVGVERVLGVDERDDAAGALGVGHRVQGNRRLAGGLRTVDLHHATAREATEAQRDVE